MPKWHCYQNNPPNISRFSLLMWKPLILLFFFFLVPQGKKLAQAISSSQLSCGDVCKRHVKHFVNRRPYKIFRKDGGIPEDFQSRVGNAMSLEKPYNLLTFNCLHFALWLLEDDGEKFQLTYVFINVQCQMIPFLNSVYFQSTPFLLFLQYIFLNQWLSSMAFIFTGKCSISITTPEGKS